MAGRPKRDLTGTEYDKSLVKKTPVLFPPPAWASEKHHGLVPRYGIGGGSGLLPRFQTAEAMEAAIETYFEYVTEEEMPPTMAGLALALGFKSVKPLKNYEEKGEDFAYIIEVARTRIEDWKNRQLLRPDIKQVQGYIFDLKNNHGWADKIEQKTTHEVGGTLADLLVALQGNVLKPVVHVEDHSQDAIEAEFTVSESFKPVENPSPELVEDEFEGLV